MSQVLIAAVASSFAACAAVLQQYERTPKRVGSLQGPAYVAELMDSSDNRFYEVARMSKDTFKYVLSKVEIVNVRPIHSVCLAEQLLIFMFVVGHGHSVRQIGERFQRGNETVSK